MPIFHERKLLFLQEQHTSLPRQINETITKFLQAQNYVKDNFIFTLMPSLKSSKALADYETKQKNNGLSYKYVQQL